MTEMNVGPQYAQQIINAKVVNQFNNGIPLTINQLLEQSDPELDAFIDEFNDSLTSRLMEAKQAVFEYLADLDEHEWDMFLNRYRYPYRKDGYHGHNGITDLCKLLILCHITYQNWALDSNDITQNLLVGQGLWRRIIHSCWNQYSMPAIIIDLAMKQKRLIGTRKIFPHRLVITNSNQRKHNLCHHCGNPIFPFDKILDDFGKSEDRLIFTGAGHENNLKVLESVEVYDGYCMVNEALEAVDETDAADRVRRVL